MFRVFRRLLLPVLLLAAPATAVALPPDTLRSVVSVLPVWPDPGGGDAIVGIAPEGSGVVLRPRLIATAWHALEPALRVDVRLSDGRILPARIQARDPATDIAILAIDEPQPPIDIAPPAQLGQPVCAIGNAYGLGLSVSCGVVSALYRTDAGFNAVEDFVQTDAAANPGSSGGALVDEAGRLVGMMSAIFSSASGTDIGINFAVSTGLLLRVVDALASRGEVHFPGPGWQLAPAGRDQMAGSAAPVVVTVASGEAADRAGIRAGDRILRIGQRRIRTPRDAVAALAVQAEPGWPLELVLLRAGHEQETSLALLPAPAATPTDRADPPAEGSCPHPDPVCRMRSAVFAVSGPDDTASATRIGPRLLVTSRHVVADRMDAMVHLPDGPRTARVVPSAHAGDLVLLEADRLPAAGHIPGLDGEAGDDAGLHFVGLDPAREEIRVFAAGGLVARPDATAEHGRLQVTAPMPPQTRGGALVDAGGALVAIAAGGGDGRFEALPLAAIRALLDLRDHPEAASVTRRLGQALAACGEQLAGFTADAADAVDAGAIDRLRASCAAAGNPEQLLAAGRSLAAAGAQDAALALLRQAADRVPNSIRAGTSLLVALRRAGRFGEMTDRARRLVPLAPNDPQALLLALQAGVWGKAAELAEAAFEALLAADPRQADAMRGFLAHPPPTPARR